MFDNLRQKSAEEADFLSADEDDDAAVTQVASKPARPRRPRRPIRLGLSPVQGFVLALMLFLNVSVLGCFALLVFEKVVLPVF